MLNLDGILLLSLSDFKDLHIPEAIESGHTFMENALIKARHYYNILKLPVISDDSGLVVPALNNEPGVYSARYAGPDATDKKNNDLLLQKLASYPLEKRKAYFQANIVYKDDDIEEKFSGRCDGFVTTEPRGDSGFGYDPLFFVPALDKTYAQLSIQEKGEISHRGMAIKKLKTFLEKT